MLSSKNKNQRNHLGKSLSNVQRQAETPAVLHKLLLYFLMSFYEDNTLDYLLGFVGTIPPLDVLFHLS
jgi:hypothetical protein